MITVDMYRAVKPCALAADDSGMTRARALRIAANTVATSAVLAALVSVPAALGLAAAGYLLSLFSRRSSSTLTPTP